MSDHPGQLGGPPGEMRFVGRAREKDLLLGAARRPPTSVFVEGEAGVGKSRLIREVSEELATGPCRVLTGYCHPLREPLPYGPVVDALRGARRWLPGGSFPAEAEALARLLPDHPPTAGPIAPPAHGSPQERAALVHAVRELLSVVGPTVLIIEDAHWIDDATRDLLLLLTRDPVEQLCLVVTYRAEDLPPDRPVLGTAYRPPPGVGAHVLHLRPLDESSVRELASWALGESATPQLVDTLFRRSGGLPLVAEEDLLTLREHRSADGPDDDVARLRDATVPRGLREAVTERLAGLSQPGAEAIAAAAVLAVAATEELLCEVAGLDEDEGFAGLVEALRASILKEAGNGRYTFRHALAQQVVYERLPGPVRRRLHAGAVRVLDRQPEPPLVQIAHHVSALGDGQEWVRRAVHAVERAQTLGDVGTAATLMRQILERPEVDEGTRSWAALALAPLAGQGVDFDSDAAMLRAMLADPRLPTSTRGEIRIGLGLLLLNQSSDRAGFDELALAVEELGETSAEAVPAMMGLAVDEASGPERAEEWMVRAERVVQAFPGSAIEADVRATRISLSAGAGDPSVWDAVSALPRIGQEIGVLRQTARATYNAGLNAIDLGADGLATRLVEEGARLAEETRFPAVALYAEISRLRLDAEAGRWEGLSDRFEALAVAYPDTSAVRGEAALFLGTLDLARGRYSRAAEHFARASALGERQVSMSLLLRAAAGTATARLTQGRADEAWDVVRTAVARLRLAGAWPRATGLVPAAVAVALARGQSQEAGEWVREATRGTEGRDAPAATAELCVARGRLVQESEPDRAAALYEEAYGRWRDIGRPYPAAQCAELWGHALARLGSAEAAATAFDAATDVYKGLEAVADLARVRRIGRESGLTRKATPGRKGYGDRLSPRETEVALLLARGAANQEIADALVLSPRTVEHHVANVLRKLNTTRRDVGSAMGEEDRPD
ncbi:ATP-binding protein [Streptomyces sp. NPDC094447]|uniref:ATP-binding protein n=1 Tax=Streptomyces sp. NPDC094447 TaxID=3366062 RepID=UPI003828EDFA